MTTNISGERIFLRRLQRSDLTEEYLSWLNDPEVNKYLEVGRSTSTMKDLEDYYKSISSAENDYLFAIIAKDGEKHIGNVRLGPVNRSDQNAGVGIMIGDKNYLGKGLGPEAIKLVSEYAFNELGLHKLFLYVVSENKRAINAYLKVGFKVIGEFREHTFLNDKFYDVTTMELMKK